VFNRFLELWTVSYAGDEFGCEIGQVRFGGCAGLFGFCGVDLVLGLFDEKLGIAEETEFEEIVRE
jgi:hypothetical protein